MDLASNSVHIPAKKELDQYFSNTSLKQEIMNVKDNLLPQ